jgi:hypothetical protein
LIITLAPQPRQELALERLDKFLKLILVQLLQSGQRFTFTTWTPSFTNFTLGNGSYTARYGTSGKFTHFELLVALGSTSSVTGTIQATLPTTPKNTVANTNPYVFCHLFEQGVQLLYGAASLIAGTPAVQIMAINASGTYASQSNTSSTVPFTWGTNDVFIVYGSYEEA